MAQQQTRSERLAAWLNRQALLQPDGTYLVRPFSRLPIVYQVDAATKDRLIRGQLRFRTFSIILMVLFIGASHGEPWALTWGLLAFGVVLFGAGYGTPFFILRRSQRVPTEQWVGPAVIDPDGRFSRKTYLTLMFVSGGMALFLAYLVLASPPQPGGYDWQGGSLVLLCAIGAIVFGMRYRRSAHRDF